MKTREQQLEDLALSFLECINQSTYLLEVKKFVELNQNKINNLLNIN